MPRDLTPLSPFNSFSTFSFVPSFYYRMVLDGSGTRRVVQILSQLGVLMVSEDPETYDIHADIVGGWPNVVEPVLMVIQLI